MPDICVAKSNGRLDQRIEHRLQVEGRAADDLEHIGGGGLLLQRFAQLVEQPHVLDGDYGLIREINDQLDLLVCEWPDLLTVDADGTNQLILFEHGDGKDGPSAGQRSETWGSLPSRDVCILNRLLRADDTAENVFRAGISQRISSPLFLENRRRVVHRDDAERISLVQYQRAELRLAEAYRILQHRVEYRLQLAG